MDCGLVALYKLLCTFIPEAELSLIMIDCNY